MMTLLFLSQLCFAESEPEQPNAEDLSIAERAATIYTYRCAICHGQNGGGDGPTSMAMEPKPSDFSLPEYWENRTDAFIMQKIRYGSPEVFMPAFPKIPDPQLEALITVLKSFQQPEDTTEQSAE